MEDHSVDISIRKVGVRLNDTNVNSEINGECVDSMYIPSSLDTETQVTRFNEENEGKCHTNHTAIADDFREKLHICKDSKSCGFLNGCSKLVLDNVKCVESVNGINLGNNIELINSHLDKFTNRTCSDHLCNEKHSELYLSDTSNDSTSQSLSNLDSSSALCDRTVCNEQIEDVSSPLGEANNDVNITYLGYESESQMPDIMRLIQKDLSEPYSIYTYRYFIHNWPKLCFLARAGDHCVGAIVCKLDVHKKQSRRGYIAMLAVDEKYRKKKIGSNLVLKAIHAMVQDNADEVVLETEITNKPALRLYENLGFVRDKRLFRYYLNGVDALRLKLWLR